jgi:hypothetical protein
MRLLSSIPLFFSLVLLGSCDIVNPAEPIPTYIHIDSFQFIQTPNTGTASQKITSVWVYLDGKDVGAFDLPATIPIIAEKAGQIRVSPGVTYSGLNDILTPYVFFLSDTMTLNPAPGQTVTWTPKSRYMSDTLLNIFNVDFETGFDPFTHLSGTDSISVTNDPNHVFEGTYAGYFAVNSDSASEELLTQSFFAPKESFVELNYRGSLSFEIGLQSTNSNGQFISQYLFGYKARPDWNKVYIGLQDFIDAYPDKAYRVIIRVNPEPGATGYVSFDNLKVISRK